MREGSSGSETSFPVASLPAVRKQKGHEPGPHAWLYPRVPLRQTVVLSLDTKLLQQEQGIQAQGGGGPALWSSAARAQIDRQTRAAGCSGSLMLSRQEGPLVVSSSHPGCRGSSRGPFLHTKTFILKIIKYIYTVD